MLFRSNLIKTWKLVYENSAGGGAGDGAGTGAGGQTPPPATLADFLKANPTAQEDLNKIVAENRRNLTKQNQELVTQLEELKQNTALTAQQKEELEARIHSLETSYMSKEEIAKKEADKQRKLYDEQQKAITQERDSWRTRYTDETIKRSLTDAAVEGKAWNPEQIVAILGLNTILVEEADADGKKTGNLTPIVKFSDISTEGKPVTLELTPAQAIKRMKELPKKFGNLFQTDAASGLGANNGASGGASSAGDLKDLAKYAEWRKKHPDLPIESIKK